MPALAVLVVLAAAIVLLLRVLTHIPFFDESLRVRYLYLLAKGLKPNVDFFAPHPMLGFHLVSPVMRILPESSVSLLALRFLSVSAAAATAALFARHGETVSGGRIPGLVPFLLVASAPAIGAYHAEWSVDHLSMLSAFGAFLLMLEAPTPARGAAASALCVLSVLVMPKYLFPLLLGMAGSLAFAAANGCGKKVSAAVAGGFLSVLLLAAGLFAAAGDSLTGNLRDSLLLQYRYAAWEGRFGYAEGTPVGPVLRYAGEFAFRNPLFGVPVAAGLAAWGWGAVTGRRRSALPAAGILAGTVVQGVLTRSFMEQYLSPALLCLSLFAPYAFPVLPSGSARRLASLLLAGGATVVLLFEGAAVSSEFGESTLNVRGDTAIHRRESGAIGVIRGPSAMRLFARYDRLLALVPPDERVVAAWPIHPMFRRDATFVTFDENPSHAVALSPGDPMLGRFDPGGFREAMERRPPALVALPWLEANYPPGWAAEAGAFIARNRGSYVSLEDAVLPGVDGIFLRKDLAERMKGAL